MVELECERVFAVDPDLRAQAAGKRTGVHLLHVAFEHAALGVLRVPVEDAVLQVGEQARRGVAEVLDAVDRGVVRDRHLHARVVVVERHRVVAGLRLLRLLAVAARVVRARVVELARERHHEQVAQVAAPRAGDVRLREAEDALVRVAVAAAVVPPRVAGVGPRLHEPERIRRRRVAVAVVGTPDERVDLARRALASQGRYTRNAQDDRQDGYQFHFHSGSPRGNLQTDVIILPHPSRLPPPSERISRKTGLCHFCRLRFRPHRNLRASAGRERARLS